MIRSIESNYCTAKPAIPSLCAGSKTRPRDRGFTLAETVIALLISGLLGGAALMTLGVAQRALISPRYEWNGERLMVAPSIAALSKALDAQAALIKGAAEARAIYILGGRHPSLPSDSSAAGQRPLERTTMPTISDFSSGLPLSAQRFYENYRAFLGNENLGAHPEDFSVIMVGAKEGKLGVTLFAQVRRSEATPAEGAGGVDRIREVRVWTADGDAHRYAFAERADKAGSVFCGAIHSWYRYHESTGQYEEGPTTVAFPDPWLPTGVSGEDGTSPPFSRFCHFWPISQ